MKCPKCGYVSQDYLSACRKCSVDLLGFKAQVQLHVVQAGQIDLRSVLGEVQPSPMASGEFALGEVLFDSPMLVEAQGESGFDINLDDDFSFTPSGMSLESLDGFEISNIDTLNLGQQPSANPDNSEANSDNEPDASYATVMMDVSGVHGDSPPSEPSGDMFDAPIELSDDGQDMPIESAEAIIDLPDLLSDNALVEPDLTSAELRSTVGRTSDLDITSMELKRTTRDIEIMNQLKEEAFSGDVVLPGLEALRSNDQPAEPATPELYNSSVHEPSGGDTEPPDTASPFDASLPEAFPEEAEPMSKESGELILPSFDDEVLPDSGSQQSNSASDVQAESFTMPDLPEFNETEKPVNPFTEEISLAIDPLAPPEPPPTEFPSLQTRILPGPISRDIARSDHAAPEPTEPAVEDDAPKVSDTDFLTTQLNLGHPDSPQSDDDVLTASPLEATLAEEELSPLPAESASTPNAAPASDTGYNTIEMDIDTSSPSDTSPEPLSEPLDDVLAFDLPEQTDAFFTPAPDEATIVDEPSPFASANPTGPNVTDDTGDTGYATIALNIDDMQPLDEPALPDLPEPHEAFGMPAPDEATIVDEPSPFASTGQTPVDFTVAPPNTSFATIELDMGDTQPAYETSVFPDLPEPHEAFGMPAPDEATIVDEPSPFAPTGHAPGDLTNVPPQTLPPEANELDVHEIDNDLELELLFPAEEPPPNRDE